MRILQRGKGVQGRDWNLASCTYLNLLVRRSQGHKSSLQLRNAGFRPSAGIGLFFKGAQALSRHGIAKAQPLPLRPQVQFQNPAAQHQNPALHARRQLPVPAALQGQPPQRRAQELAVRVKQLVLPNP